MTRYLLLTLSLAVKLGIMFAQSPFDGTWLIDPVAFHPPKTPLAFLLAEGLFRCTGCLASVSMKADGQERSIPDSVYWNTASVHPLDARTVEITTKKE
jgi:hypothetical protein